jgi:Ig-like domain-containing protein
VTPEAPTPVPGAVDTIVAQTAQAAATQTALQAPPTLTPTYTAVPTKTASVTPSPSPTFVFLLASLTNTPKTPTFEPGSGDFSCQLTAQTPEDGAVMKAKQSFTTSWTVLNTGGSAWDANSTDFVFVSGAKLSPLKAADLPQTVASGESTTLKLSMQAPNSADTYKTVWTLHNGKNTFCRVTLSIVVK